MYLKICLLSAEIISVSKNSDKSMESLLFPVAVAHRIMTIQFSFSFLKSEIRVFICGTISSTSIARRLNVKRVTYNGQNIARLPFSVYFILYFPGLKNGILEHPAVSHLIAAIVNASFFLMTVTFRSSSNV
jgi:hypothetical protein